MKKINRSTATLLLFALATLVLNCTPKAKPASSGSTTTTTGTSTAAKFDDLSTEQKISAISALSDGQYNNGMTVYQAKCGKCHKLFDPKSRDIGGWLRIMRPMSKKANLTEQEYKEVAGYLYNNCQK